MTTFSEYKERKLERLRLGQAVCEITELISDPDTRIALVPLTEGEYSISLAEADKVFAGENAAGAALREEVQQQWILYFACREMGDLTSKFFGAFADVQEIDAADINHLYDIYLEMVANSSPALSGLGEDDFNSLKALLPRMAWNELSGPAWYAAERFLNSIRPQLLTVKSPGSSSTMKSTQTSETDSPAPNVE